MYSREPVHERLRDVADDREAAAHVAVERAVADGELALVAGREQQVAELFESAIRTAPRTRAWRFSSVTSARAAAENAGASVVQ